MKEVLFNCAFIWMTILNYSMYSKIILLVKPFATLCHLHFYLKSNSSIIQSITTCCYNKSQHVLCTNKPYGHSTHIYEVSVNYVKAALCSVWVKIFLLKHLDLEENKPLIPFHVRVFLPHTNFECILTFRISIL